MFVKNINKNALKTNIWWLLFFVISVCIFSLYYSCTIVANSFGLDQYKLIEYSKEILEGNFRLVGMRTSRLNWNFPMINYLITPLVAITSDPWALYISTAVTYVFSILSLSWILFINRPFSEFLIFAALSMTHAWSLFYSSYLWQQNYIPFFVTLFFICFFQYLKHS